MMMYSATRRRPSRYCARRCRQQEQIHRGVPKATYIGETVTRDQVDQKNRKEQADSLELAKLESELASQGPTGQDEDGDDADSDLD